MIRIGREANAGERGLQLVLEHSDRLDRVARNLWGAERGLVGADLVAAWLNLNDAARESVLDATVAACRDHAATYVAPRATDDMPPPGERVTAYRIA